ncbi:MAG TPA: aspartate aminotransferase family protein, partial [Candidatus Limnocylindria bacterium]|nr:aspartate aminotransferase family protein [Candidatus Limnocylindria bacterium]
GVEVLNEVVLNQVLVRFGDEDDLTRAVIARAQADGTAWMGGTTWHGKAAMRISVSNWATTEADADASVQAILRAHAER